MSHEHNPGCDYQAQCVCGWKSNWGDSDNAFYTGWDHSHGEGASSADREMFRNYKGKHVITTVHAPIKEDTE